MDAPVFLIFCVDVNRILTACRMNGETAPEGYLEATETFLMGSVDTGIAAQNAVIAARGRGFRVARISVEFAII